MEKPFFIMLMNQKGDHAMPVVDDNEEVMFFPTEDNAREAIDGHMYAEAFGYEIFQMGTGA